MNKINWKKELKLLPGYIVVVLWVGFTAVMLCWILGASFSTSREIFSGNIFKFETGIHWENYVTAWQVQNVSVFFVTPCFTPLFPALAFWLFQRLRLMCFPAGNLPAAQLCAWVW